MTAEPGEQVLYLYGIIPCGQPLPSSAAIPLQAVPFSSLAAVVEPVPSSEFSPEALEQKLQSINWVAPMARRHSAVLEDIMRHGPVVPAHLCTLFSSAEALARQLAENEQRFQDALRLLGGRQEWGLKVFCDEARLRSTLGQSDPQARALEAAITLATPGQGYVLRKKRDGRIAQVASDRINELVDEMLDAVASATVDARLRPVLSAAATGRSEAMVLNAAVLVDIAACDQLRATLDGMAARLAPEGFGLELTGPWPPYSFCDEEAR